MKLGVKVELLVVVKLLITFFSFYLSLNHLKIIISKSPSLNSIKVKNLNHHMHLVRPL